MATGVLRKIASEVTSTEKAVDVTTVPMVIALPNPLRYSIGFSLPLGGGAVFPPPPGVVISSDPSTDGTKGFNVQNVGITLLKVQDYGSYAQGSFSLFSTTLPVRITVIETVFNKDE